jgi:hypothetical protein
MSVTEKKLFDVLSAEEFERVLREYYGESNVVFCREKPIKELILREILSNEREIEDFVKRFNTKISFLDKHIDRVVKLIVSDCKRRKLYKKLIPKKLIKELIYHYIEYVSLRRVQHQYTKSYSRRKRKLMSSKPKPQSLNKEQNTPQTPRG